MKNENNMPADGGLPKKKRELKDTLSAFDVVANPQKDFDLLVFIGRFQPFHNEHKRIIDIAMERAKHVLVLIGSSGKARTTRNPFTFEERRHMIQGNYPSPIFGEGNETYTLQPFHTPKLVIKPLYDKMYDDTAWIKQVQQIVDGVALDIANPGESGRIFRANGLKDVKIGLIGAAKDNTSYYLKMFPQWDSVDVMPGFNINIGDVVTHKDTGTEHVVRGINHVTEMVRVGGEKISDQQNFFIESLTTNKGGSVQPIHATAVREGYISGKFGRYQLDTTLVPQNVAAFLFGDRVNPGFTETSYYAQLRRELKHVEDYKKAWAAAPYPVKHLTVDAVVEQSGHVLLVRRKAEPGKGLWALPGGHLEVDESLASGVLRELREETKIKVPDPVLRGSVVASHMFDDPHRSQIGRVVTFAQHIKLADDEKLPKVKGSDDAEKAMWVPIGELREEDFFDDHFHIIQYFLGT